MVPITIPYGPPAMTADEFLDCRKAIPMTTEQLGAWLSVTRMTIWRYEHGRARIPDAVARTMRDAAAQLDGGDLALMDRST